MDHHPRIISTESLFGASSSKPFKTKGNREKRRGGKQRREGYRHD
jgi:hypothetical protein